jgi:hypothetical protein
MQIGFITMKEHDNLSETCALNFGSGTHQLSILGDQYCLCCRKQFFGRVNLPMIGRMPVSLNRSLID